MNTIQFAKPYRMNPMTLKMLGIMVRDGGITHMMASHYGIGGVTKEVQRLRESQPLGYRIDTIRRKDAEGKRYTRWTLNEVA
jgi:hypothetical protein